MKALGVMLALLMAAGACRADTASGVLREMNFARQDPRGYAKAVILPGARSLGGAGTKAEAETVRFLNAVRPLPPLLADPLLALSARAHVDNQGKRGGTGHRGSDWSSPFARMKRQGTLIGYGGENISYGCRDAQAIVSQLIVDEGVRGRGHRKNIFNTKFAYAGVATGPHVRYGTMCVIDFATKLVPRGAPPGKMPLYR